MRQLRPLRLVAALLALVVGVSACSSEPPAVIVSGSDPATSAKNIVETLETEGFTVFAALIERAGLTETLSGGDGDETYTVFAPPDSAFADLGAGVDTVLMGEEGVIVVPLSDAAAEITAPEQAEEQAEEQAVDDEADVAPQSGPEQAIPATSASEVSGDVDTGTINEDEPSPSAEESAEVLTAIVEYHIVEGTELAADVASSSSLPTLEGTSLTVGSREEEPTTEGGEPTTVVTVDDADVVGADLRATNGVIHTIEGVLVPEDQRDALRELIDSIPVAADVMTTLRLTGDHGQLVAAIEAAGLEDAVADAEAITIFAPTDAAFEDVAAAEALSDPDVLREVLLYHAVGRRIIVDDIQNTESVATLQGERLTLTKDGDTYTVNDVVIDRQIPATNGAIHVIDEVLVPQSAQGPGGL